MQTQLDNQIQSLEKCLSSLLLLVKFEQYCDGVLISGVFFCLMSEYQLALTFEVVVINNLTLNLTNMKIIAVDKVAEEIFLLMGINSYTVSGYNVVDYAIRDY